MDKESKVTFITDVNDKRLYMASLLLESISRWFYKRQGMEDPIWKDEFIAVCQIFEPEEKQ